MKLFKTHRRSADSLAESGNPAELREMPELASLPQEFDASAYRERYPDLREATDTQLANHWRTIGKAAGRNASAIGSREAFVGLIDDSKSLLEIGPFTNPLRRGRNVKYLDVLPTELLRQRAKIHGRNPELCPEIDFVSATGDLDVVDQQFDAVLSSHVIEHQPDLIRHLQAVSRVLNPGGVYYVIVPDKRYCFDHFIAESSVAEIIAAHVHARPVHDVRSVIEHRALTTHNDPKRHWAGEHGEPVYKAKPQSIREALTSFQRSNGNYIDVHAWQFVPDSFAEAMRLLFDLGLSVMRVLRVYPTVPGANEFYAVLEKTELEIRPLQIVAPQNFDEQQYLLANPDVAAAGADALEHYLVFGHGERRKLRP